jgi:hypothetical protein
MTYSYKKKRNPHNYKRNTRRIYYHVIWYSEKKRFVRYFCSAKRARNFVNYLIETVNTYCPIDNFDWEGPYIEIEKIWCRLRHTPRHKWYYLADKKNQWVRYEWY